MRTRYRKPKPRTSCPCCSDVTPPSREELRASAEDWRQLPVTDDEERLHEDIDAGHTGMFSSFEDELAYALNLRL